jgi:hypothetical protein
VHQQNPISAKPVGLPLLLESTGLFSPQNLKKLNQRLDKVVNTVGADPGGADQDAGNDFKYAVGEV